MRGHVRVGLTTRLYKVSRIPRDRLTRLATFATYTRPTHPRCSNETCLRPAPRPPPRSSRCTTQLRPPCSRRLGTRRTAVFHPAWAQRRCSQRRWPRTSARAIPLSRFGYCMETDHWWPPCSNPSFVSPTDNLMTPCTQKISAAKKKHFTK